MNSISRRRFIKKVAAGSIALTAGGSLARRAKADTAEFTLKFGNYQPVSHPNTLRSREIAAALLAETGGRVDLQVYPAAQLGNDTEMLSQLRAGSIDFMLLAGLTLATLSPMAQLSAIGFAFEDYDHVWAALDGDLGALVRSKLSSTAIFAMEQIWDGGYRQITTSNVRIKGPDDLRGVKMRVPPAPMLTSMFQMFGASPTTVTMSEVYSSLQTHIVDGQENPLVLIDAAKLYEVQKYCAVTSHVWDGFWLLGNKKRFERMPADLQAIVSRHMNAGALKQREDVRALNDSLTIQLKDRGMVFDRVDPAPFREKLVQGRYYESWKGKLGDEAWSVLERYAGRIT